jgi:hypothetical protein
MSKYENEQDQQNEIDKLIRVRMEQFEKEKTLEIEQHILEAFWAQ